MNQSVTLFSSSSSDPDDSVDDVTFKFTQIQINAIDDSNSLPPESKDVSNYYVHQSETADVTLAKNILISPETDDVAFEIEKIKNESKSPEKADVTFEVEKLQNETSSPENDDVTLAGDDVSDEDEDEFTFACFNDNGDNDDVTKLYLADETGTVFPLFDQSLLYNAADNENGKRINVPVNNVFIESPRRSSHSGESSSIEPSTFTALSSSSDSNEINIKSNSTGFSKLWRFRDNNNMNRSHSDGRDAFVFLNQTNNTPSLSRSTADRVSNGEVKGKEVKKKVKKVKESAHEVYLKQKGGKSVEEKRKSYLPYRPGLMGFFTNVNGGLSKNVHPF